ncbi:hypothetical protein IDH21_04500 [Pelagibacterales bacterium SAG-MED47]|nr:hypothetical protein [Pelagibacterales bacterium SAG-MED47]
MTKINLNYPTTMWIGENRTTDGNPKKLTLFDMKSMYQHSFSGDMLFNE